MKQRSNSLNSFLVAGVLGISGASLSQAALVINVNEVSGQVVISATGSINMDALPAGSADYFNKPFYAYNNSSTFYAGHGCNVDTYVIGWAPFTLGASPQADLSSASGPLMVGVEYTWLVLPTGYVSGSDLSGSTSAYNGTIAGLGMTVGTETRTFSNDGISDSVTVNVNAVPEPSSLLIAAASLGLVGLRRKRNA
jgi:hypothetical protein